MYISTATTPYNKKTSGFTLIEVLVSLSIFTVVVTIAVSALLSLIAVNARTQNSQSVMTNLSFALDSMTREIRTGQFFYCGSVNSLPVSGEETSDCTGGGVAFAFQEGGNSLTRNASSKWVGFRLNDGVIERRLGDGDGDGDTNEDEDWFPVTSENIDIEVLRFVTTGSTRRDDITPSVTIYLSGTAGDDDSTQAAFNVQTTVAQQLIDI